MHTHTPLPTRSATAAQTLQRPTMPLPKIPAVWLSAIVLCVLYPVALRMIAAHYQWSAAVIAPACTIHMLCGGVAAWVLLRSTAPPGVRAWALLLVAVLLLAWFAVDMVNALLVSVHLALACAAFALLFWALEKAGAPALPAALRAAVPFALCAAYFAFGWQQCHSVAEKRYTFTTEKPLASGALRVAHIADIHLGTTFSGAGFAAHLARIKKAVPDMLVITGDFVDDDTTKADMLAACAALGQFSAKYGVYYVNGNHDLGYHNYRAFGGDELLRALQQNHVVVLRDEISTPAHGIAIIGRQDARYRRQSIQELRKKISASAYAITLNHQPTDYENEAAAGVDLVLSGHTHGGQMIGMRRWLSKYNDNLYGHQRRKNTDFIVTSGMSDWAVKFKTGTRSEYVIIDIRSSDTRSSNTHEVNS